MKWYKIDCKRCPFLAPNFVQKLNFWAFSARAPQGVPRSLWGGLGSVRVRFLTDSGSLRGRFQVLFGFDFGARPIPHINFRFILGRPGADHLTTSSFDWSYIYMIIWPHVPMITSSQLDHMITWPYNHTITRPFDHTIIWSHDHMTTWSYGHMITTYSHDHMITWSQHIHMIIWSPDHHIITRSLDHMIIWSYLLGTAPEPTSLSVVWYITMNDPRR